MTPDDRLAQGFRLAWRYCPIAALIAVCFLLSGCGEPASTWSDKQGRYRPTDEVRREIINEEIDRREMERGR
jgi:hypothetical protein